MRHLCTSREKARGCLSSSWSRPRSSGCRMSQVSARRRTDSGEARERRAGDREQFLVLCRVVSKYDFSQWPGILSEHFSKLIGEFEIS